MRRLWWIVGWWLTQGAVAFCAEFASMGDVLEWQALPDLPQPVSGHFAGVSADEDGDVLIVAGGSNFPVSMFEGGKKVWLDAIHVLGPQRDAWRSAGTLDRPLAYGATVTTVHGMICLGGGDAKEHFAQVFRLRWRNGALERTPLPDLPGPCAFMGAAVLGETIYVAGGRASPNALTAMRTLWALHLPEDEEDWKALAWRELDPWPGAGRLLPIVAAQDGGVYVISGAELVTGADGKPTRRYLTDGWRFRPKAGWARIADAPKPVIAGTWVAMGPSHLLILGGDDGANAARVWELKDRHPGFSRDVWAYHTITDTWTRAGTLPAGLVTTHAVWWKGRVVIPGGEDRPGHRSAKVLEGKTPPPQKRFGTIDFVVVGVYLGALVVMGVYFSRREKSTEDFFLGGRRVPWWAAGLSIFGTQLSAITFMGIPAKVYATDWTYILANMCIFVMAPVIVWLYLPFFRRLDITTAYEYLEKRFGLPVRLFGSSAFILFQLGRMAIVLCLPAIALSAVTGIDVYTCILVMGVLCTIYTVLGGIEAVIWTDVLQVIVLMGGALLSLIIVSVNVEGGFTGMLAAAHAEGKFHTFTWTWDYTVTAVWVVFIGNLFSTLGPYTTDQAVIQRYLTTRDEKQAAGAIWTNGLLTVPAAVLFFGLGTALYVFYKTHPGLLNPALEKTDSILPWFVATQLPVGVSGLVIAGLFAAAMSSLDSSMNSMATAIVTDFYRRFKRGVSDHTCLNLARWLTVVLGVFGTVTALLMATWEIKSLWDLFIKVLGLLGGSLSGLFALGIFTRRANGTGGLIGAGVSVVVLVCVQQFTNVHFFLYAAVGVITCFVVGYVASVVVGAGEKPLGGLTIHTVADRRASQPSADAEG